MPQSKSRASFVGHRRPPREDVNYGPGLGLGDPAIGYISHAAEILRSFGFSMDDPEIQLRAVMWGRREYHRVERLGMPSMRIKADRYVEIEGAVVYYMRVGNRVKIGWTTNLQKRVNSLMPEEVLAVEQGGSTVEMKRHEQFDHLRTAREWFRYEDPLVTHIASLPRPQSVKKSISS